MSADIDSLKLFKLYDIAWIIEGFRRDSTKYFYGIPDFLITVFVTIGYPLHLIIGLFYSDTQSEVFVNLVINISCGICSVKFFIYRYILKNMREIYPIFRELDKRIQENEQQQLYYRTVLLRDATRLFKLFVIIYISVGITSLMSLLMSSENRLLYPAWLPFDWEASTSNYIYAVTYQFIGLYFQIIQNFANDVFAPLTFCIFAGHVHLLRMRVASIGNENKGINSMKQHNRELIKCIIDYQRLISIYKIAQEVLSLTYFIQFLGSGLNICVALICLIYFSENFFTYVYYMFHLAGILVELFPCCYYGSLLEQEFIGVPSAIFSSNWLEQNYNFRRTMIIFTQLSLRGVIISAGGMARLHLSSFFSTCRVAYSFFTLILTMK